MNERPNIPLSEQIYRAGTAWAERNAAAQLLEESKTAYLSQSKSKLGDIPDNKAERIVKASDDWSEYIERMVDARREANLARVKYDALKARMSEWIASDANHRLVSKA
jgi:hypothetical protein